MAAGTGDEETIEAMEIDLDIAEVGEILTQYGVEPTADLVHALWEWKDRS